MLAIIITGFAMMTLGIALLSLGEVPFLPGKRISAIRSRLIGALLVLFLPTSLGVWLACNRIFEPGVVDGLVVTWVLCGIVLFAVSVILFRVMVPKKAPRSARATTSSTTPTRNPFAEAEPAEQLEEVAWLEDEPAAPAPTPVKKKAPAKKPRKASVENDNPFDFS